jgi:hypothetical protein
VHQHDLARLQVGQDLARTVSADWPADAPSRSSESTAHMAQPMVGSWDVTGIAACLVIATGGIGLGAWGMRRRDVR